MGDQLLQPQPARRSDTSPKILAFLKRIPLTASPLEQAQARLELYENAIRGIKAQIKETEKERTTLLKDQKAERRHLVSLHRDAGITHAAVGRLEEELAKAKPGFKVAIEAAQAAKKPYLEASAAVERAQKGRQGASNKILKLRAAKADAEKVFGETALAYLSLKRYVTGLKDRLDGQRVAAAALARDAEITQVNALTRDNYYAAELKRLDEKLEKQDGHLKNYQNGRDETLIEIEFLMLEGSERLTVPQLRQEAQA